MRKLIFIFLASMAQMSVADWQLNDKVSSLSFISTKNASVTEVHTFKILSGGIKKDGGAVLRIGLESVETNIAIRNERMRQFLFETDQFKEATVELQIDSDTIKSLEAGERVDIAVKSKLDLHGVTQEIEAQLRVVKMQNNGFAVSSIEPILIAVGLFDMQKGLDKLKEIAKLTSITTTVPVTLNLVFDSK